jgi:hypothetical protein
MNNIEKETIINFNEAEKEASVYTFNQKIIRTMKEYTEKFPDDCKLIHTGQHGELEFTCPKSWIKIRAPRILTEEQRRAYSERARANFGRNS